MSVPLFEPDSFSDPVPRFSEAGDGNMRLVRKVAASFSKHIGSLDTIEQIGGVSAESVARAEANASNFKVSSDGSTFVFKRVLRADIVDSLDRQIWLMRRLFAQGIPVPEVILSDDGRHIIDLAGEPWYLMRFVEGRYFSGVKEEIAPAGKGLGALLANLARLPAELTIARTRPDYFTDDERRLIQEIGSARPQWPAIFGTRNTEILESGWNIAESEFAALSVEAEALNSLPRSFTHFDLHPHNILMRDGQLVSILDFDACYQLPIELAIGFAVAKLMKRVGLDRKINPRSGVLADDTGLFLAAVGEFLPSVAGRIKTMKALAKAEILRRLLSVCNHHLNRRRFVWNDIPVHLAALLEVDEIFPA